MGVRGNIFQGSGCIIKGTEATMSVTAVKPVHALTGSHQTPVIYDPSCRPLLTNPVRTALDGLISLLTQEAEQKTVPVLKMDVRGFSDPEEDGRQIVVRQWVRLPAREAFLYWDSLGPAYEAWLHSAPEGLKPVYTEQIAFEIRWSEDATKV